MSTTWKSTARFVGFKNEISDSKVFKKRTSLPTSQPMVRISYQDAQHVLCKALKVLYTQLGNVPKEKHPTTNQGSWVLGCRQDSGANLRPRVWLRKSTMITAFSIEQRKVSKIEVKCYSKLSIKGAILPIKCRISRIQLKPRF